MKQNMILRIIIFIAEMFCGCTKPRATMPKEGEEESCADSPLQLKLIKMLGLKNYLLDIFIFRRKKSSYYLRQLNSKPYLFPAPSPNQTTPISPLTIPGYTITVAKLSKLSHSVPVLRMTPQEVQRSNTQRSHTSRSHTSRSHTSPTVPKCTILYAHGNASDMGDSIKFITGLAKQLEGVEFVIFDYTGYGESSRREVGEEIIADDIQLALAWINRPISKVIVWGFSLGSYPATSLSSRYPLLGLILHSPIASLSCMFYSSYQPSISFKDDHFSNLDLIPYLPSTTSTLIIHSLADEIIPIEQARLLYNRYTHHHGDRNIEFVEVQKLSHNSMHRYIIAETINQLQKEVIGWIYKMMKVKQVRTEIQIYAEQKLEVVRKNMVEQEIEEWEGEMEVGGEQDTVNQQISNKQKTMSARKGRRRFMDNLNCLRE